MDRLKKTISDNVEKLLINQISHELYNHNLYNTFANYFSTKGITDLEKYYRERAKEEYIHHQWIFDRLCEADCDFEYPSVDKITESFNDEIEPFKLTVLKEIETTELINKIMDSAMEEKDWQTVTWLQSKLIPEQHEEESTSRTALNIISNKEENIFTRAKHIYELLG